MDKLSKNQQERDMGMVDFLNQRREWGARIGHPSLTLRQWYAGMALQGELASQNLDVGDWMTSTAPKLATRCFAFADAMIAYEEQEDTNEV